MFLSFLSSKRGLSRAVIKKTKFGTFGKGKKHLEESEWKKRCHLIKKKFPELEVPDASAGITVAEQFFCYCSSLRGKDVNVVKEGITKLARKLDDTISNIATICSSSGHCTVKRLVEEPEGFLSSLETVSKRLGESMSSVWSIVCSGRK